MSNAAEVVASLVADGEKFTWANVGRKSAVGGVESLAALSPEWITWTTRVRKVIEETFGDDSAVAANLSSALKTGVKGHYIEGFQSARNYFLAALELAERALEVDTFGELLKRETAVAPRDLTNKVFIVHGHDEAAKNELEIMLRDMGLDPIVLHRKADEGRTIIEKFEAHADVGYAFILLSPDEISYLANDESKPDAQRAKELRARPNVIWEFGYFVGRLSRKRTCCLYRGGVTLPSDLDGLIYKQFSKSVEEQGLAIQRDLKAAGYILS